MELLVGYYYIVYGYVFGLNALNGCGLDPAEKVFSEWFSTGHYLVWWDRVSKLLGSN